MFSNACRSGPGCASCRTVATSCYASSTLAMVPLATSRALSAVPSTDVSPAIVSCEVALRGTPAVVFAASPSKRLRPLKLDE